MKNETWLGRAEGRKNIVSWAAPCPEDDGVSLLVEQLRHLGGSGGSYGRIGMPMGHETSLRMPLRDFERVRAELAEEVVVDTTSSSTRTSFQIVDATSLMQHLRLVKTEAEISKLRAVCAKVGRAFERFPDHITANTAWSELNLLNQFRQLALQERVDDAPFVIGKAGGEHGYSNIVDTPTEDCLIDRDDRPSVFGMDTGCRVEGYWSDYTCNWELDSSSPDHGGRSHQKIRRAHAALFRATRAAMELLKNRPVGRKPEIFPENLFQELQQESEEEGPTSSASSNSTNAPDNNLRMSDLFTTMRLSLEQDGYAGSSIGRMGHGLGLELTEWPSVAAWDHTLLRPGMVLRRRSCTVGVNVFVGGLYV